MAGQKYWKKVKGEWVNTLDLKRQQQKKVGTIDPSKSPKPRTEKERPQKTQKTQTYKGGGRAGFQHGGRTNLLEELGRVEGEHSNRNRRAEVSRIHGELNKGYSLGGRVGAAKRGFNKKILRKD